MDEQAKSQWYTGEEWLKPKPTPGKLCYNATDPLDQVNPMDATLPPCKPKLPLKPAAAAAPMLKDAKAIHAQAVRGQIEDDDDYQPRPSGGAFLHRMRPPTRQFIQLDQQIDLDQQKSNKIEINFVQENVNLDEEDKQEDQEETEAPEENAELIMQQTDNIQQEEDQHQEDDGSTSPDDKKLVQNEAEEQSTAETSSSSESQQTEEVQEQQQEE